MPSLHGVDFNEISTNAQQEAAKRLHPAAAGFDGRAPSELRAIPLPAWALPAILENRFRNLRRPPTVYYHVPVSMLRKGDGILPEHHRGITVFSACYRLTNHVWWKRLNRRLADAVHPSAYGGVPRREPTHAAYAG